jgi:hypothetical protein
MALTNGKLISPSGSGTLEARAGTGDIISRSAQGWGLISSAAGLRSGYQFLVTPLAIVYVSLRADLAGKSTQGWGISSRSGAGRLMSEGK